MNTMGYNIGIGFLFLTLALSSIAATPPPKPPFDNFTWKSSLKDRPSAGLKMGEFYLKFEKTTLDEVRQAVGAGEVSQQGDAGNSLYWLCFTSIVPHRVERIWIISHGEMGGENHEINGIDAEIIEKGSSTKDCPALPSRLKPVALDHDLWLDTQEKVVHAVLGPPSYKKKFWESFDYEGKVPAGDFCEQLSSLVMQFKKGQSKSLHMWQMTSC